MGARAKAIRGDDVVFDGGRGGVRYENARTGVVVDVTGENGAVRCAAELDACFTRAADLVAGERDVAVMDADAGGAFDLETLKARVAYVVSGDAAFDDGIVRGPGEDV